MDFNSENNFNTLPSGFNFGFTSTVPTNTASTFPAFALQPIQQVQQPQQQNQQIEQPQLPRWNCMPASTFSKNTVSFNEAIDSIKRRKENNIAETKETLFKELHLIRSQIEILTKSVDNIYSIISKLN